MTGHLQPSLIYHTVQGHTGAADPEYVTSLGAPGLSGVGWG